MLCSGKPGVTRMGTVGTLLLLAIWVYTFYEKTIFLPSTLRSDVTQKKIHVETTTSDLVDVEPEIPLAITTTDSNTRPTATKNPISKVQSSSKAAKPSPENTYEKTVIMGKIKSEDTSWVQQSLPEWRPAVYAVDDRKVEGYLHVSVNKGREAMAYLTYLIDYYDDLSEINVFIHAHRGGYPQAWHNEPQSAEYSAIKMLELLRLDNIREKGYVNLRCNGNPGCPAELHPNGNKFEKGRIEIGWKKLWKHMNGDKALPNAVGVACCAQFAVTKEKIREKPKSYYENLMDWLLNTDEEDPGRVFEYFWHVMFGMPMVHCEGNYQSCICRTYDCGAAKRSLVDLFGGMADRL
ncbi:hypothetical protein H072_10295 [Dactylellina haptotyla CBS 200.50]|uniref:Uncharacterized protein n=1 Tax=Dactylellina haptotyla (strain CBS 200.50) TaxID=1284197 RepID=S8BLK9_DACHA|nr:hypothetical protein H072_10295 [Dactylellina haptotyla CBS 200.50]